MILKAEKYLDKKSIDEEHFYYAKLIVFNYRDRENEESFSSAI